MSGAPSPSGRVLALDVGEKRVGIAISDRSAALARPLDTIPQHPRPEHFAALKRLVAETGAVLVVVGHPISLDGTEGPQARRIQRYRSALARELDVPSIPWDERYSTAEARDLMRSARGPRRKRARSSRTPSSHGIDAVAAAVILQSYLDSLCEKRQREQERPPDVEGEP